MVLVNKSGCWQLGLVSVLVMSEVTISASRNYLLAQIVPDRTLEDESSAISPNVEVKGLPAELIEGGAARDSNLFHSFAEFNVGELQRVYFANPAGIENILSRVTGSNVSNILGTLGVAGSANLFFLNPNGIIFGENARLDVAGSFVGSTANSFVFPDGSEFSATNPTAPPLLTINLTPGLQYGQNPRGDLVNSGNLTVAPRQTLSLSGKDVTNTGNLTAPGGTVQLLGERVGLLDNAKIDVSEETGGGNVFVGGNFQGRGSLPNAKRTYIGPNVNINADALTTGDGGRVIVWADEVTGFYGNISARGGSVSGNGGLVEVSAKEQLIFRGDVDTSALSGFPGILLLDPTNITIADGTGDSGGDGTDSFAGNNSGVAGSILSTPLSEINDTAPTTIYKSELEGLSGDTNVFLQATNNITVNDLSNNELNFAAGRGAIAFTADADGNGVGNFVMEDTADTIKTNGRNIAISGASLTLGNIDASITADGAGQLLGTARVVSTESGVPLESISGNLFNPTDVDLFQIYLTGDGDFSASTVGGSQVDTQLFLFNANGFGVYANDDQAGCNCGQSTLPPGNPLTPSISGIYYLGVSSYDNDPVSGAGEIFPDFPFNSVNEPTGTGGAAPLAGWSNTSFSSGGNYTITLSGAEAPDSTFAETATANSGSITLNATNGNISTGNLNASSISGNAGDINLMTNGNVSLTNSLIGSDTRGAGNAGDINITAGSLSLTDGAQVSVDTLGQGQGGNLTVTAPEFVELIGSSASEENSALSSTTFGAGNAGDLTITTGKLIVKDGAVVTAGAFPTFEGDRGQAGKISVTATESVELIGGSGIFTNNSGDGDAGDLTIKTGSLILQDSEIQALARSQGDAGNITLIADDAISLLENSSILSRTWGAGNAGNIDIKAGSLFVTDGARVSNSTFDQGNAGNITLIADDAISLLENSFILSRTWGAGHAGNIDIKAGSLFVTDGARVSNSTFDKGHAGNLTIETNYLNIRDGAQVSTTTSGTGSAGKLTVNASDGVVELIGDVTTGLGTLTFGPGDAGDLTITTGRLIVRDQAVVTSGAFPDSDGKQGQGGNIIVSADESVELSGIAGIFTSTDGAGDAGDLTIDTKRLFVQDSSSIQAITSGRGNGGNIQIKADDSISVLGGSRIDSFTSGSGRAGNISINSNFVNLSGTKSSFSTSSLTTSSGESGDITVTGGRLRVADGASVEAQTRSTNKGGEITVNANTLEVTSGGQLSTTTFGSGQAGNIILKVPNSVTLKGEGSGLFASTQGESSGNGGSIFIDPETIILQDGASIAVNSQGSGKGGNIELQAGSLSLDGGTITAQTTSNQGGNINLQLFDLLTLRNNSQISATAGTAQAGGDGGNIDIDVPFILNFPGENNNITAEAFLGTGGNINITTNRIFGREFLDISTLSQFGLEGTVSINTLELDPSQGLVELPSKLETPQILQGCEASRRGSSSFINTGRGGLPPSPTETLSSREVWKDVQLPTQLTKNPANTVKHSNTNPERIVEANAWIINEEGILELIAEESSDTRQGSCR